MQMGIRQQSAQTKSSSGSLRFAHLDFLIYSQILLHANFFSNSALRGDSGRNFRDMPQILNGILSLGFVWAIQNTGPCFQAIPFVVSAGCYETLSCWNMNLHSEHETSYRECSCVWLYLSICSIPLAEKQSAAWWRYPGDGLCLVYAKCFQSEKKRKYNLLGTIKASSRRSQGLFHSFCQSPGTK
uniref:Uncharacterized protein n=1 Tax=Anguilla anguilla TaxID=7936 RepID=A0A0E9X2L6_ANGAN